MIRWVLSLVFLLGVIVAAWVVFTWTDNVGEDE